MDEKFFKESNLLEGTTRICEAKTHRGRGISVTPYYNHIKKNVLHNTTVVPQFAAYVLIDIIYIFCIYKRFHDLELIDSIDIELV